MTRVRFDAGFLNDPRWERLGADAYILHTQACAYVVHTLSDGFITTARAVTLSPLVRSPKRVIKALAEDGLWMAVDGGWRVCACHDDMRRSDGRGDEQPTRAFVEAERERTRKRKERWNAGRNGVPNPDGNAVGNGVPNGGRNGSQSSAEQCSAGTKVPVPAPALADETTVCEHGDPHGLQLTSAGTPRCAQCRRSAMKLVGDA